MGYTEPSAFPVVVGHRACSWQMTLLRARPPARGVAADIGIGLRFSSSSCLEGGVPLTGARGHSPPSHPTHLRDASESSVVVGVGRRTHD
eukprot:scaffold98222_cov28-Tisochrysis_lutea.AAC.2